MREQSEKDVHLVYALEDNSERILVPVGEFNTRRRGVLRVLLDVRGSRKEYRSLSSVLERYVSADGTRLEEEEAIVVLKHALRSK